MERARFALAIPDEPTYSDGSRPRWPSQADPPISLARSGKPVIAFQSVTGEIMLRSRVIQALELAAGPDWQSIARPVG